MRMAVIPALLALLVGSAVAQSIPINQESQAFVPGCKAITPGPVTFVDAFVLNSTRIQVRCTN